MSTQPSLPTQSKVEQRIELFKAGCYAELEIQTQVQASPVYDAPRFARNFEAALWGMWQAWRNKQ